MLTFGWDIISILFTILSHPFHAESLYTIGITWWSYCQMYVESLIFIRYSPFTIELSQIRMVSLVTGHVTFAVSSFTQMTVSRQWHA